MPRLKAAGADLERVHIIADAPGPEGPRPFDLDTDLLLLNAAIRTLKGLRVVVVDAVNLSGGRAAEQVSRSVLDRLRRLAKAHDVSIMALVQTAGADRGVRKPAALDALTLGTARAAFVIEADPADGNRKLLLQAKNELARDPGTLAFRIAGQEIDEEQTAARIEFEPQYHSLNAGEFAARQARGFNSARAGVRVPALAVRQRERADDRSRRTGGARRGAHQGQADAQPMPGAARRPHGHGARVDACRR